MDELLEQFVIEGRELVAEAHDAIGTLSRNGGDRSAIDRLFRAVHTLKGSVAVFDMAPSERLLHAAESYLDPLRRGGAEVDAGKLEALVAAIDQTDRWIDAMEARGTLGVDAGATAERLIALIGPLGDQSGIAASLGTVRPALGGKDDRAWAEGIRARAEFASVAANARTAFRYAPDTDCFFRGEDPLALAAHVPALLALTVLPAAGEWPALADCEPFQCLSVIEGLSGADPDAVRHAFPLAQDQIRIAQVAGAPATMTATPADTGTILRVEAAKLDRLADRSGDMGVAARALSPLIARAREIDPLLAADLREAQDEIARVARSLQHAIAQIRLVSLEPALRRLPRLARETAASLGKRLRFKMSGEATQVDKQIADQLFEPLMHLVRNAIDHGIEPEADRLAAGKSAEGEVTLVIRQEGDSFAIVLSDDGRGIDPDLIRDVAVAKGLVARDAVGELSDDEALRLIFLPGFSTTTDVTEVSGRGVGMDAVKVSIDRLGGAIAIESEAGRGSRFVLRLPVNAISTPLLVVLAGNEHFGVRLDQIVETARIEADTIQAIGLGRACVLRESTVPVLDLAGLLGLGETRGDFARLIVTDAGGNRTAIRVESIGERYDSVVRERSGLLAAMPQVAGTALRPDGSVLLVLDLPELIA